MARQTLHALRTELEFSLLLVLRQRGVLLAVLGAGSILWMAGLISDAGAWGRLPVALAAAGTVASVAGAHLLTRGGPFETARRAGSGWPVVVAARLGAVLLVSLPVGTAAVAWAGAEGGVRLWALLLLVVVGSSALTAALGSHWAASEAAALGVIGAWLGLADPAAVRTAVEGWAPRGAAILEALWTVLPLPWRGGVWVGSGGFEQPAVLAVWSVAGVAWLALRVGGRRGRVGRGGRPGTIIDTARLAARRRTPAPGARWARW